MALVCLGEFEPATRQIFCPFHIFPSPPLQARAKRASTSSSPPHPKSFAVSTNYANYLPQVPLHAELALGVHVLPAREARHRAVLAKGTPHVLPALPTCTPCTPYLYSLRAKRATGRYLPNAPQIYSLRAKRATGQYMPNAPQIKRAREARQLAVLVFIKIQTLSVTGPSLRPSVRCPRFARPLSPSFLGGIGPGFRLWPPLGVPLNVHHCPAGHRHGLHHLWPLQIRV